MNKSFVLWFVEVGTQSLDDFFLMVSGYFEKGVQLWNPPLQSLGLAASEHWSQILRRRLQSQSHIIRLDFLPILSRFVVYISLSP